MEKMMTLVSCSQKLSTKVTRRDGSSKDYYFYQVKFTDGIDTIFGETSEAVTNGIASDGDDKIRMLEGHLYTVRVGLNVADYEKDGVKKSFLKANFYAINLIV